MLIRIFLLLATLLVLPNPSHAGSDLLLWCRGGDNHGDTCVDDDDCAGGDGTTTGICTQRGMPRACIGTRYCAVTQSIECRGNQDCTAVYGGTWPTDPADYCPMFEHNNQGCDPAAADTGGALDCGECAGGQFKGKGCLADGHCPGSTCDKSAGLGKCADGASQCELQRHGHKGYGQHQPGDILADLAIGPPTLGDNIERTITARTLVSPTGVEVSPENHTYVSERRRVTRRPVLSMLASNYVAADAVIGQVNTSDYRWGRVGDDYNVSIIPITTPETLHVVMQTGTTIHRPVRCYDFPDLDGCLVGDWHRLLLHPDPMATDSAATKAWGHTDLNGTRTFDAAKKFDQIAGVAAQRRCVGGSAIGTPCATDGDCPSSTCATTIAVADRPLNRILVQRAPGAGNGSAFDVVLGQQDFAGQSCNAGGRSASTLCGPTGLTFDANGNLWVADRENHRILRFPHDFGTGESADIVIGQFSFTTATSGTSQVALRRPNDVIFDLVDDILFVADTDNNRILSFRTPHLDQVADGVFGQSTFTAAGSGTSSDGTLCDRVSFPLGVGLSQATGHVLVADTGNHRVLSVSYDGATGQLLGPGTRQGQPNCTLRVEGEINASSIGKGSGGVWFFGSDPQGVCITDEAAHRVLCWNDRTLAATTAAVTPDADFILGQADATSYLANRGATAAAGTLNSPSFGTWTGIGDNAGGLFLTDTGNNRVLTYFTPFSTGMDAAAVLGQPDLATTSCGATSTKMCGPNAVKADASGNLWVADTSNGRVLLFCQAEGSVAAVGGGTVCTGGNSGDGTADLVLGRPDFTSGFSSTLCSNPTASTLCRPWDVAFDAGRGRVFVGDQGLSTDQGRTLVYESPFANGMAASHVLGIPTNVMTTYAGSNSGICNGGPTPGASCTANEDWTAQGSVSSQCGAGGFCDWSRSFPGQSVAFDPVADILYVDHAGSIAEIIDQDFPEPGVGLGAQMGRLFGATNESTYSWQTIGYTSCQWTRQRGQFELDSDRSIWVQQGSTAGEHNAAVFVLFDPAPTPTGPLPATATPTTTNTPTSTATNTPTSTPTNTPTLTPTSTPTDTPTVTPTFTVTPTGTVPATPTFTHTATPTRTPTSTPSRTPTSTPPPPTAAATATPSQTFTPAPIPACCGDCDGNGTVTQAEVQTCSDIYLTREDISVCPACDCEGDGTVTLGNITAASSNFSSGCPQPPQVGDLPGYALNPLGTNAIAHGQLRCVGDQDRACIRQTLLTTSPESPVNGDTWCLTSGQCCVRINNQTRCWNTTP